MFIKYLLSIILLLGVITIISGQRRLGNSYRGEQGRQYGGEIDDNIYNDDQLDNNRQGGYGNNRGGYGRQGSSSIGRQDRIRNQGNQYGRDRYDDIGRTSSGGYGGQGGQGGYGGVKGGSSRY